MFGIGVIFKLLLITQETTKEFQMNIFTIGYEYYLSFLIKKNSPPSWPTLWIALNSGVTIEPSVLGVLYNVGSLIK